MGPTPAPERENERVSIDSPPTVSRCTRCGFDPTRWRRRDVATLLGAVSWWWTEALQGSETGSERGDLRLATLRDQSLELAGSPGDDLSGPGMDPAGESLLEAAHRVRHLMMEASGTIQTLLPPVPAGARLVQVNTSGGGVPKAPVTEAQVDWDGLSGDRQADSKHHGRPFQAVCLWSAEVIAALAGEGHPIAPGSAGENLTVSGLPWARIRPGALIDAGSCQLEISFPAVPCKSNPGGSPTATSSASLTTTTRGGPAGTRGCCSREQ